MISTDNVIISLFAAFVVPRWLWIVLFFTQITTIVLRAFDALSWSWVWVLSPTWLGFLALLLFWGYFVLRAME